MTKFWLVLNPNTNVILEANPYREGFPPVMSNGEELPVGYEAYLVEAERYVRSVKEVKDMT